MDQFMEMMATHYNDRLFCDFRVFRSYAQPTFPTNFSELHLAAITGDVRHVSALLNNGADINCKRANKLTPLHAASENGCLQVVKLLVERNAIISEKTNEGFTPLHLALQQKHLDVSEFLIKNGADVNACDSQLWTPLHNACYNGSSLAIVKALIERGSIVDAKIDNGQTSLHFASEKNYLAIAKYLIEKGADVNSFDNRMWSPLHFAAYDGNLEMVKTLIGKSCYIDAKSEKMNTPLHFAVDNNHAEVVKYLLHEGADVNCRDKNKMTPLHDASENGNEEIVRLLLQSGADANLIEGKSDGTPLHYATSFNHADVVNALLEYGANVNVKQREGATPLYLAVQIGNSQIAKALLVRGAYFDVKTRRGAGIMECAKKLKRAEIVKLLEMVENLFAAVIANDGIIVFLRNIRDHEEVKAVSNARHSNGWSALHYAINKNNTDAASILLVKGADVDGITEKGNTPLHIAVAKKNYTMTGILLHHAKQTLNPIRFNEFVNAKTLATGTTALHLAVQIGSLDVAKLLFENGAIFNAKNIENNAPSDLANNDDVRALLNLVGDIFKCLKENKETNGRIFEKEKSAINARDENGCGTPLYWAVLNDRMDYVKKLLGNGADPTLVTSKGNTPLHLASSKGNNDIAVVLLEYMKKNDPKNLNSFANAQTKLGGNTALHVASDVKIVKSLLQYGAIYNIKNKEGKTPLDCAKNDVIRKLLSSIGELF